METLFNGFTLETPPGTFPLSMDSFALADFARLPRNARVLDLGSGCATLGILLCAAHPDCTVTGIERDVQAHLAALENIRANRLSSRLTSICADWGCVPSAVEPEGFSCCISNPPYFTSGARNKTAPEARHAPEEALDSLFLAASRALRWSGDFYLVHPPERLARLCAAACANRLEPKLLCLLRHRRDGPVNLVLLQCRKGAKPGLRWQEESLYDEDGAPTEYFKRLYHL